VLIILGDALQVMPPLRRRLPVMHRWVGRVYSSMFRLMSMTGLYMQVYFAAQRSTSTVKPRVIAIGLFALTVLTAGGIVSASMIVWIPRI
jgi:hypothetical protein